MMHYKNGFIQGRNFVFMNPVIQGIWKRTQEAVTTKDPYTKLEALEKKLRDYIVIEIHKGSRCELEARRALVLINMTQIKILEVELNEDIDGDGIIGFGEEGVKAGGE